MLACLITFYSVLLLQLQASVDAKSQLASATSTSPSLGPADAPLSPDQAGRNYARKTLQAVHGSAHRLLERSKSSSAVLNFAIGTVEKVVQPAKSFTVSKVRRFFVTVGTVLK